MSFCMYALFLYYTICMWPVDSALQLFNIVLATTTTKKLFIIVRITNFTRIYN